MSAVIVGIKGAFGKALDKLLVRIVNFLKPFFNDCADMGVDDIAQILESD